MWVEKSNYIEVQPQEWVEDFLVLNEEQIWDILDLSTNPEEVRLAIETVLKNINGFYANGEFKKWQMDDFLDISMMDEGRIKVKEWVEEEAVQKVADALNKVFEDFLANRIESTKKLLEIFAKVDLWRVNGLSQAEMSKMFLTAKEQDNLSRVLRVLTGKNTADQLTKTIAEYTPYPDVAN